MHPTKRNPLLHLLATAACFAVTTTLLVVTSPGLAQDAPRLEKIEVEGQLKTLTTEQVITSSGLQLGQNVDRQILQAAVDKMMKSRMYSSVGYRVRTAEDKSTVTLEVVESPKPIPKPTPAPTPKATRPRTTRRRPQ
jgi:outer membrane protein assembly factor BamA